MQTAFRKIGILRITGISLTAASLVIVGKLLAHFEMVVSEWPMGTLSWSTGDRGRRHSSAVMTSSSFSFSFSGISSEKSSILLDRPSMACDESPCFWAHKDFKLPERASEFALHLGRALFFGVLPICSDGRRLFKLARCRRRRWSGCCTLASCRQLAFGLTQLLFNLLQPTNRRPFNLFRLQRFQSWNNLSNYRIDNIHRLILFWRNQVWVRCQCSATASTSIPLSRMHVSNWEQKHGFCDRSGRDNADEASSAKRTQTEFLCSMST